MTKRYGRKKYFLLPPGVVFPQCSVVKGVVGSSLNRKYVVKLVSDSKPQVSKNKYEVTKQFSI